MCVPPLVSVSVMCVHVWSPTSDLLSETTQTLNASCTADHHDSHNRCGWGNRTRIQRDNDSKGKCKVVCSVGGWSEYNEVSSPIHRR